jgi:hypothetical protein
MAKQEAPLEYLKRYIPEASAAPILHYLNVYKVHLTITRERRSVLGDYRHATHYKNHRISINGNLNSYSFLITLIHEMAHLVTFIKYGHRVAAHGKEWKETYAMLLVDFLRTDIFPDDILTALKRSLPNLPASSCSDEDLMRVLKKYDKSNGLLMVEQLEDGTIFQIESGMVFKRGKKLRKRFQCVEIKTGKLYLFSPIYEVKVIDKAS